ncbi:MAG: CapA family protein, partial [Silvanigrellaceae bacterium]
MKKRRSNFRILLLSLFVFGSVGCKKKTSSLEEAETMAVNEQDADYSAKVNDEASIRPAVPFETGAEFIDLRGVGDSAWSGLRSSSAPASGMKTALEQFDPSRRILKGDLNFINWESSVGTRCSSYYNVDYAFLSRPEAVLQAFEHGFNLFGLANNHSEDCASGVHPDGQGVPGAVATAAHMKILSHQKPLAWHGVGPAAGLSSPSILTFSVKSRLVKVVFGSIAFQDWECVESACEARVQALLGGMKSAAGDLRILSVHSQGNAAFIRGKNWSERFIREFSGDVVFASGPHTWAGVKIVERDSGGRGVVFNGLGNFMHNQVAPNPDNLIGRVLLDSKTLQPKQVQVIPVLNNARDVDVVLAEPGKGLPRAN